MRQYAVIDVGTVTMRLLVAGCDETGLHERTRIIEMVHLGEGLQSTGSISTQALERAKHTLGHFKEIIATDEYEQGLAPGSIHISAVATSAARDASNAQELESLFNSFGINLCVIEGAREAELSFRGVVSSFSDVLHPLVVDIGGGSTEVIFGDASSGIIRWAHSFDIGCRRVTDLFLQEDPPAAEELLAARSWICQQMRPLFNDMFAGNESVRPDVLIAVAGTATSLVSIREHMEVYDSARVHGSCVRQPEIEETLQYLATMNLQQRRQVVGLESGRAGVIVAGLIILDAVLELSGFKSYRASETDLLQGVVLDTYQRDGAL